MRNYAVTQKRDHIKYSSIYSTTGGETMMLNNRSGLKNGNDDDDWNARPSTDSWHPRIGQEYRDDDLPPVPVEKDYNMQPGSSIQQPGYGVGLGAPSKQHSVDTAYLEHPSKAHTDDPGPTPNIPAKRFYAPPNDPPPPPSYDTQEPQQAMAHPGRHPFHSLI